MPGLSGRNGRDGDEGPRGHDGKPGSPGSPGLSGKDGRSGVSRGDIVVVHSQSRVPPECPGRATKLWDGYSFVQSVAAGSIFGDDLGKPGSCLRAFTPTPFTTCHGSGKCAGTDDNNLFGSDWLANEQMEEGVEIPVHGGRDFVSRCSVCEAPGSVLTVHSQLTELPDCPPSWESLWTGYSYWSVSAQLPVHDIRPDMALLQHSTLAFGLIQYSIDSYYPTPLFQEKHCIIPTANLNYY